VIPVMAISFACILCRRRRRDQAGLDATPLLPYIRGIVPKLEREAFQAGYYKAFGYACGPCHLCEECNFDGPCEHPDESRPAMEACGIDVFATARAAGFPIGVVTSHRCEQNYYGLVLVE